MDKVDLYSWCKVPVDELIGHPGRVLPLELCANRSEMGIRMARGLIDETQQASREGRQLRVIIPCGPSGWYQPFTQMVNQENISLRHLEVFHMDECLDWEGRTLPRSHPYSFRGTMQKMFYDPVRADLVVPEENRHWLEPATMVEVEALLERKPADLVYGGWGQDGHVAYNQARRSPFTEISIADLRNSTIRIQENNTDTIIALAQRVLGSAFQLTPPMSITLGMRQILSAAKIRLFSDTGAWKQTALRVGLFSPVTAQYPITLLQEHPDVLITATRETADHPVSRHPEWDFGIQRDRPASSLNTLHAT